MYHLYKAFAESGSVADILKKGGRMRLKKKVMICSLSIK